jgi:hypothetical protein
MLIIMPESEDNTLIVKATERLTTQDYENIFIPQLEQRIAKFGNIKVLFNLAENFAGMELGAAWDDAVFGVRHRHNFEKIAVVSDRKWVEWATKLGSYFIDGKIKTYTLAEFQDAMAWIKQ